MIAGKPTGGVQVKWSHYWPEHLNLDLAGDFNLELFVINYVFGRAGSQPWDYWLQCVRHNRHEKLPLSEFCRSVLLQLGLTESECHVLHPGYSREVHEVDAPRRRDSSFRFLTVTNSHDLGRYNTLSIVDAFRSSFGAGDDAALVIKDYGASSGDTTIRQKLAEAGQNVRIEYVADFTDKHELIRLYKSCDAFVSAHRGEGYGMKILDAMACGLPVITPLFGGPTAFCTPDTAFPVEFSLIPMGDCLDARSLHITNQPMWADANPQSLAMQMRRVFTDREAARAAGARGRASVVDRLSWDEAAKRLVEVVDRLRVERPKLPRSRARASAPAERSPYWLGLRVSVIVPTHNRVRQLLECLDALGRQSVLPQEFEVIVIDDGSTDGTEEAVAARADPFALRYCRQDKKGPGAARNLGIEQAAGELVLFIGDDIFADEHLLEEHLLAHAANGDPGLAVLGHIDWAEDLAPNAVMRYVCGDATLQFAYTQIPHLAALDHRFFYTSNISLKRQFLLDAADAGIRFDPGFYHAAFEDSEFAYRLSPRGLKIRYAARARAFHDHSMDLDSFASREFKAGEMAVVFYRKHPEHDDHLRVRWLADLVRPAEALLGQPDLLRQLETFDCQTDTLLRGLAGSLDTLLAMESRIGGEVATTLSAGRLEPALHNLFNVIFDVERTRGKVQAWFAGVDDPARCRAAQALASVLRKIEFLNLSGHDLGGLRGTLASIDAPAVEGLRTRIAELGGSGTGQPGKSSVRSRLKGDLRRLVARPGMRQRLITVDRALQRRLEGSAPALLERYRRLRGRIRRILA